MTSYLRNLCRSGIFLAFLTEKKRHLPISNYSRVRVIYLGKCGNHRTSIKQLGKLISELDYHDQQQTYLARHIKKPTRHLLHSYWRHDRHTIFYLTVLRWRRIMLNHSLIGNLSRL